MLLLLLQLPGYQHFVMLCSPAACTGRMLHRYGHVPLPQLTLTAAVTRVGDRLMETGTICTAEETAEVSCNRFIAPACVFAVCCSAPWWCAMPEVIYAAADTHRVQHVIHHLHDDAHDS